MEESEWYWKVERTLKYNIKIVGVSQKSESKEQAIQESKIRTTKEADEESFSAELVASPKQVF